MTFVKGVWYAIYYKDGKSCRKSLQTADKKIALRRRGQFLKELVRDGATVYAGRSAKDKLNGKPDLYIYSRPPYQFKIGGKVLCESWDRAEVEAARDAYVKGGGK